LSTAPQFILWWSNLEILFAPLHRSSPYIGGLRCQAIQTEHGPYIAERTQKAVYIVRCLWLRLIEGKIMLLLNPFLFIVLHYSVKNAKTRTVYLGLMKTSFNDYQYGEMD
jgi:hypothetical protein